MRTKLLALLAAAVLFIARQLSIAQIGQTATLTGHRHRRERSGPARRHGHRDRRIASSAASRTPSRTRTASTAFPPCRPARTRSRPSCPGSSRSRSRTSACSSDRRITVDPKLEVGGFEDRITVAGGAPVVDVKSSAAQKNLTEEVMENIPFTSRFGPGAMLLAPGVQPERTTAPTAAAAVVERLHDRRRRRQRSGERHDLALRQPQLDPGSAGHRPRRQRRVRRLHRRRLEQPVPQRAATCSSGLFETLYENDALTGDNVSR